MSISMYSRGETFKLAFFPSSIGHKLMHQQLLQKTRLVHKLLNVQKKKRSKNGKICSDFRDQPTGSLEGNPKSAYSLQQSIHYIHIPMLPECLIYHYLVEHPLHTFFVWCLTKKI